MEVTITQIRFGGLNVSKGVKAETTISNPQPDTIIPEQVIPEQIIPERIAEIGETIPERIIASYVNDQGETIPEQIIPEHVAETNEIIPEYIIPGYIIPEQHIANPPKLEIGGYVWQYICTLKAMPCTGALPDFQEIEGNALYILENIFGFKMTTTYALEIPASANGGEPSMQSLIMAFTQWFGGEVVRITSEWVGKTIIVNNG